MRTRQEIYRDCFIESLYENSQCSAWTCVRHVHDQVNRWLCEGEFAVVDMVFASVDCLQLSVDQALSLLTITFAAKGQLGNRHLFLKRAWNLIATKRGAEVAHKLLCHL